MLTVRRIGPDVPLTHWMLHWPLMAAYLCRSRFGAFGEGAAIRPGASTISTQNIFIGRHVVVRMGSMLSADDTPEGTITIEDDVLLGPGVHIYVADHLFERYDLPIIEQGYGRSKAVRICRGAWIGANAVILKGVTVGENAVVGAGAVVTRDVPPRTIVGGVPARILRHLNSVAPLNASRS